MITEYYPTGSTTISSYRYVTGSVICYSFSVCQIRPVSIRLCKNVLNVQRDRRVDDTVANQLGIHVL